VGERVGGWRSASLEVEGTRERGNIGTMEYWNNGGSQASSFQDSNIPATMDLVLDLAL